MRSLFLSFLAAAALSAVNVRDFGAAGNGSADDTPAFQKAAGSRHGAIEIPRGVYRLTRTITLDTDRHGPLGIRGDGTATIRMAGPGPAFHLKGTHTGTADPKTVAPMVWERQRMPLVDGFAIEGAHPEADGLRIEGIINPTITRVLIRQVRHGIVLTGRNRNVIISDCHIYDNRGAGILMERLNLHQVNITGCHVSYNRMGGIVARESEIRNLQVTGCDLEANMSVDGPPSANLLLDTRKGSIREGAITGCTLQHDGKAPGSANIRMLGTGPHASNKVGFFSIADNTLSDVAINIHLRHARGVNITGNTFAQGFEHNLLVEESSNVVLGPNSMDQNPDYDQGISRNDVVFLDSADSSIHGLHINRSRGKEGSLVLRRCRRFHVTGTTILDSDGIGILLDQVEWVRLAGSLIHDSRPGAADRTAIRLTGGSGNRVEGVVSQGKLDLSPQSLGKAKSP
ncbi:MAG: right-handed parallel beta-helix repeat-containing protein [Bryobacteraceae bacterium]